MSDETPTPDEDEVQLDSAEVEAWLMDSAEVRAWLKGAQARRRDDLRPDSRAEIVARLQRRTRPG